MGLNFEEGGLEDLKMSFEKGDDAYTFGTPKASVKSPLSMEMPLLEDEGEDVSRLFQAIKTNFEPKQRMKILDIAPTRHSRKTGFQNSYPK